MDKEDKDDDVNNRNDHNKVTNASCNRCRSGGNLSVSIIKSCQTAKRKKKHNETQLVVCVCVPL